MLIALLPVWAVIGISLFIFYMYWVIRMRNPYTSILYIGKKGSGKSTLITKLCLQYHKSSCIYYDDHDNKWHKEPWKIYTNTQVYMPFKVHKFNLKDLGKLVPEPNSIIICDEINLVWDNRNFKAFAQDIQDFFRLARKLRVKVVMFSQSFDCDKKIRTLCDEMWLLRNVAGVWSYGKKITKVIDIKEAAMTADSQVVDTLKFESILMPHSRKLTFIPKYIRYFDSYENMQDRQYLKTEFWPIYIPKHSIRRRRHVINNSATTSARPLPRPAEQFK